MEKSSQPFVSPDGSWVIIFNGEIYNFKNIKEKIKSEFQDNFKTTGDTEVILMGFLHYGAKIVEYLEGEFSFVIFKTDGSEVFAARDDFGVKPLFIYLENIKTDLFSIAQKNYKFETPSLNFSSEIKGLFPKKKWNKYGLIRQSVGLYEPIRTPFDNIIALPPNSYLHGRKGQTTFCVNINLNEQAIRKPNFNKNITTSSLAEQLKKSIHERMLSDVELGLYLSSGTDSKIVCYELSKYYRQKGFTKPLKSFHISFSDKEYDESDEVKIFSKKFNLDLNILKINNESLKYSYPLAVYYSENIPPYTNGAAKWWLSLLASHHVKGVLTGDGADEILCGYPSFQYANWWKFALRNRPGHNVLDKLKNIPLGKNWRDSIYAQKNSQFLKNPWANGISQAGLGLDFYESLILWGVPHPLFEQIKTLTYTFLGEDEGIHWLKEQKNSVHSWFTFGLNNTDEFVLNPENTLLLWQNYFCKTHLPVQVLNWVGDRMEMANTLEGRTPYLSKHIKNYIYHLPDYNFVRGFQEKYLLKENYRRKSNELLSSKKQFNAPLFTNDKNEQIQFNIYDRLSHHQIFNTESIKKNNKKQENENNVFLKTCIEMANQTLNCFLIVEDSIVLGNKPKRDVGYEENILKLATKY